MNATLLRWIWVLLGISLIVLYGVVAKHGYPLIGVPLFLIGGAMVWVGVVDEP